MSTKELLGTIQGGRVLDVGTGRGQFVQTLIEELGSWSEIVGIDSSDAGAAAFNEAFQGLGSISFQQANAIALPFYDGTFDTACLAGALHHFPRARAPLREMRRVLRPGGSLVLYELYRDRARSAEITHRQFHEWSETALGVVHRSVYRREEILQLVRVSGFTDLRVLDERQGTGKPRDSETIARWDALIDQMLVRARGKPKLEARGEAIRKRLHAVGLHVGRAVLICATKADTLQRTSASRRT
jgi:ubiquinone/menaquinone biosynthesis C-methylase UbiE